MNVKEILNRRARHDFQVIETLETGIVLKGTEVKSLRLGRASLTGAFARVEKDEMWLMGLHVDEYLQGNRFNHDPKRFRKLLLHRSEIRKLSQQCQAKGRTLIPLKIYFSDRGYAKVLLGVCEGKSDVDRREDIRKRDAEKEMRQAMKRRRNA